MKSETKNQNKKKIKNGKKSASKKSICFKDVVDKIKKRIIQRQPKTLNTALSIAIKEAEKIKNKIKPTPRIIQIPKVGGILPLIPIFAALSALGTLSGGAAAVAKAVNDAKNAKQQLEENQRHNRAMESRPVGKGMYLKPYKSGLGLFLQPSRYLKNFP